MEETGQVIKINGNFAQVEMQRHPACANCGLCTMGVGDKMLITAANTARAKVADRVKVTISGTVVLKSAFLVYIVPLIALLVGFVIGNYLAGEIYGVACGVIGVVLSLIGLHFYDQKLKKENKVVVKITEII